MYHHGMFYQSSLSANGTKRVIVEYRLQQCQISFLILYFSFCFHTAWPWLKFSTYNQTWICCCPRTNEAAFVFEKRKRHSNWSNLMPELCECPRELCLKLSVPNNCKFNRMAAFLNCIKISSWIWRGTLWCYFLGTRLATCWQLTIPQLKMALHWVSNFTKPRQPKCPATLRHFTCLRHSLYEFAVREFQMRDADKSSTLKRRALYNSRAFSALRTHNPKAP